jgi:hypothetical protein
MNKNANQIADILVGLAKSESDPLVASKVPA